MLFEVLPDPRALRTSGVDDVQVLQIHRSLPDRVPVGHFEPGGIQVVDEVVSRTTYLEWIEQACAALGDGLELRFYDHFDDVFDASVLDHLPGVRRLSIDGLADVRSPEAVARLPRLTSLRFGPRHVSDDGILRALGVERLTDFTLAGTPTPAVDLAPLADAGALRTLRLLGHGKNTEAIGRVTSLTELAIQTSVKFSLAFISRLLSLESLKFVLGSCASIQSVEGLPTLRDLSCREVRNLEDLGDLERFPGLRRLQVSDQPRVTELRVGPLNAALEHLYLYSVPRLHSLTGFSRLPAVKSLFAYDSRLDLSFADLPPTLTHLQLMTRSSKGRREHEAAVRAKGLIPEVHPAASFFYK